MATLKMSLKVTLKVTPKVTPKMSLEDKSSVMFGDSSEKMAVIGGEIQELIIEAICEHNKGR